MSISNTVVRGRILALGKNNITLSNSTASQIVLMDGKSTVTGGDGADEIYIAQYASESSIDKIPNKLVLESGVRVRVDRLQALPIFFQHDAYRRRTTVNLVLQILDALFQQLLYCMPCDPREQRFPPNTS